MEVIDTLQEKVRGLERENSEMKAAKLMTMFGGASNGVGAGGSAGALLTSLSQARGGASANSQNSQIESLRVQLSEKTNEYLKLKDENERLREQVSEMIERHDNEK